MKKTMAVSNGSKLMRYFMLAFALAWILWLPFVLMGLGWMNSNEGLLKWMMPAIALGAFSPLMAALIITGREKGKSGIKAFLLQGFDWHMHWKWIGAAILIPLIVTGTSHYTAVWTGLDHLPDTFLPEQLPIPLPIMAILYFLLMMIIGGGQEEFGWRGFALLPLQEKFGKTLGSVYLGVIWSIWHLPLWFMPGEGHANYSFFAFALYATSLSVIIGWLYNASGNKLLVAWVMHAAGNAVVPFFPTMHLEKVPQPGYWVWACMTAITAILVTVIGVKSKERT